MNGTKSYKNAESGFQLPQPCGLPVICLNPLSRICTEVEVVEEPYHIKRLELIKAIEKEGTVIIPVVSEKGNIKFLSDNGKAGIEGSRRRGLMTKVCFLGYNLQKKFIDNIPNTAVVSNPTEIVQIDGAEERFLINKESFMTHILHIIEFSFAWGCEEVLISKKKIQGNEMLLFRIKSKGVEIEETDEYFVLSLNKLRSY